MNKERSLVLSLASLLILLVFSTARLSYQQRRIREMRAKDLLRHILSVTALTTILIGVLIYNVL
jgi:hypothetical protein